MYQVARSVDTTTGTGHLTLPSPPSTINFSVSPINKIVWHASIANLLIDGDRFLSHADSGGAVHDPIQVTPATCSLVVFVNNAPVALTTSEAVSTLNRKPLTCGDTILSSPVLPCNVFIGS